jgi:DNA-binding CsgD family transcriptional regulator
VSGGTERAGTSLRRARAALAEALLTAEREGLAALAQGESEAAVARTLGVDRMTVRKWAGKRR